MGQKDIMEKNLEDFNDVFADIMNILVFEGERDNAKYWSKGRVKIALLGLENQSSAARY